MEEPLRKTLRDESPYVRKTAAICVAKLFDLNPALCLENGFLESLQELIADPNPMVVANSVTALAEINEAAPETKALRITPNTLRKMLMALNECTEWGRVSVLTSLADYRTTDVKESESICERVVPQFQHVNSGVVIAAVKAVFLHMKNINPETARSYLKKMAPPLGKQAKVPSVRYMYAHKRLQSPSSLQNPKYNTSRFGTLTSCSKPSRTFSIKSSESFSANITTPHILNSRSSRLWFE